MNLWLNVSSTGHISSEYMLITEVMHTVSRKNLVWQPADRVNFGCDNNMKKSDIIIYYVLRLIFNFFCYLYLFLIVCLLIKTSCLHTSRGPVHAEHRLFSSIDLLKIDHYILSFCTDSTLSELLINLSN
jgi:hypothetical protein